MPMVNALEKMPRDTNQQVKIVATLLVAATPKVALKTNLITVEKRQQNHDVTVDQKSPIRTVSFD